MHMATLRSPLFRNQYACLDLFWAKKKLPIASDLCCTTATTDNEWPTLDRGDKGKSAAQFRSYALYHQNIDWLNESFNCNTFEESLTFFPNLEEFKRNQLR